LRPQPHLDSITPFGLVNRSLCDCLITSFILLGLDDLSITVVHGVGKADTGALGVEQTDDVTEPIEIPLHFSEATEHAIQVSCGDAHSSVLTDLGRVYSAGHNDNGQLGLVQIVNLTPEFVRVHSIDGAYSIACGSNHTIALLGSYFRARL
jgi:alpha-tubulin suppressor-like RCC1 family protein